ncbi:MAG: DUF4905 domain-containing protein [Bacteroidota bacterium]
MRQVPNLAFSFPVDGVIWKTVLDQESGKLAMEIRDQDQLTTSFVVVDIPNKSIGTPFQVEEADWWSSLQVIFKDYLFIEKYQDPQNPLDKSLIIADGQNGQIIQHYTGHQLVEIREGKVIYQQVQNPSEFSEFVLPGISKAAGDHKFIEPVVYVEGSDNFDVVQTYLSHEKIVSLVDYAESGEYIFISYLISHEKSYIRKLLVLKGDEEVYQTVLDKNVEGISPGAFFVFNNYLIFIVERKEINAIAL